MAFKATPMQQKAIDTDGSVLVSAAAGSGKTAVLVERVIRKLTDSQNPISADRLLIVTFTNAAAAEMRSRIEKRLHEEILKNPQDIALLRQKHLLPSADICTIDSFCIKLIRENFSLCGIEPDFKIGDGNSLTGIAKSVMAEVIEPYFDGKNQDFQKLLELTGCEFDESKLTDTIERIYLYSRQLPFPENFIEGLVRPYKITFDGEHPWYVSAFDFVQKSLEYCLRLVAQMANAAVYINKNGEKCMAYAETVSLLINELINVCEKRDWNSFCEALHESALRSVPSTEKDDANALVFKENKKQITEALKELCGLFGQNREDTAAEISANLGAVNLMCSLINEYAQKLFEAFKTENTFTFYNTEQLALELLCEQNDGRVVMRDSAKKLAARYDEVLVDEFQDVNDLQNMLFYVLSDMGKKLFVVGDVKQSIYGFRGSNPANFLDKKEQYIPVDKAEADDPKKIVLSNNFRSRDGVCNIVNYFFSLLMAGQCGDVIYNEEEMLFPAAEYPKVTAPSAELLLVDKQGNQDDDSLLQSEARAIAEYIKRVMCEGKVIKDKDGTLREARYSDFVILLDTMKKKASVISQMLSSLSIPVAYNSEDFLSTTEISLLLSLLQVVDNPESDVDLLCVMMSSVFGFTAEEMAQIRAENKRCSLYSAVLAASKNDAKAARFLAQLSEMRKDSAVLPLDRFISKILRSTDILNIFSAMQGGKARCANLLTLVKFASQYCSGNIDSIYGFIRYIKSLPESSFRVNVGGAENCVRIMSMHNSKGLQFPVCIIANLAAQINNADSISRVIYSEKQGIAFKYYDEEKRADLQMLGHKMISREVSAKTVEERMRLLYVAMTRAEYRLCLVSACKDAEKRLSKIARCIDDEQPFISSEFLKSSKTMGDWVLAAALMHPDCEKLRYIADVGVSPIKSDSNLNLTVVNDFSIDDKVTTEEKTYESDAFLAHKIAQNIDYCYPYDKLRGIQAKSSVSVIANSAEAENFAFTSRPAFMQKDGISAAGRGTAMHHIMQFINMDSRPDVEAEIERLAEWQFITEAEASAADRTALNRFFESDLYTRIAASLEVRREMRFLTEVKASVLSPEFEGTDANVIVQGAVDLCFREKDGIVVLDFKTDRVKDINLLAQTYGEQLSIYAKACEKIFGLPVKEKIIYSFNLFEYIKI